MTLAKFSATAASSTALATAWMPAASAPLRAARRSSPFSACA
jgi:hypothetical protein